jgi:hypothetical protein
MQPEQSNSPASKKPVPAIAAALLVLASTAAYVPSTSPWSRARIVELIDALVALAATHGFAQSDALRDLLASRTDTERIKALTEMAFAEVPLSGMLDAIRRTRLYTDLQESGQSEIP